MFFIGLGGTSIYAALRLEYEAVLRLMKLTAPLGVPRRDRPFPHITILPPTLNLTIDVINDVKSYLSQVELISIEFERLKILEGGTNGSCYLSLMIAANARLEKIRRELFRIARAPAAGHIFHVSIAVFATETAAKRAQEVCCLEDILGRTLQTSGVIVDHRVEECYPHLM